MSDHYITAMTTNDIGEAGTWALACRCGAVFSGTHESAVYQYDRHREERRESAGTGDHGLWYSSPNGARCLCGLRFATNRELVEHMTQEEQQ
jgi:hypothetical protein